MPRRAGIASARAAVALLLLCGAAPLPTSQQVQDAEKARATLLLQQQAAQAQAAALAEQERRLAAERVAAAARLRELEVAASATVDQVAELTRRREAAQASLERSALELGPLLPVVQRLALYPAETRLAMPLPTEDSVRGVLVLGGLMRRLEAEAAALRAEQATLAGLGAQLNQALPELARRQAAQAAQAASLDTQLKSTEAGRQAAEGAASASARKAAAEAARADSLRVAIQRIEAERQAGEARAAAEANAAARRHQEVAARPPPVPAVHHRQPTHAVRRRTDSPPAGGRGVFPWSG